jgi:hypothetical protein
MKETLRNLFRQKFDYSEYRKVILQNLLHAQELMREPEFLEETNDGDRIYGLGYLRDADGKEIGLYYTNVTKGDVRHKRVGFRKMMKKYTDFGVDAAITVFADKEHWRLSYMCDLKGGVTAAKRFSYIMGDGGMYVTPVNRLSELAGKRIKLEDIHDAFSVEALSDEFFKAYHDHYDIIVAALARQGKTGAIYHDYVKKMMGRIVFLHFLQKKGWLNGNPTFLRDLFFFSPHKDDFLDQVLEPLFFGIFNTEKGQREKLFASEHWDKNLLKEWESMPYLNGGLFERDEIDKMAIKLPASLFDDLFSFLASYNFTVDENDPDDAEIGVDPEMLGKIFESLLEDNKAKGAFYTPKEIVRYMCKESLIAHLVSKLPDLSDKVIRTFVESHEMQPELEPCRDDLESALREVKICDPAIGSGAFPMGLLNELWRCREALGTDMSRLQLKKEIIENNIYGVDIERGAIDIARLRFWLSIVVDSDKAEPLPNFDYKFMQGNSLIESYGGFDLSRISSRLRGGQSKSMQLVLGLDSDLNRKNLQKLLHEYFSVTDHKQKATMRQAINDEVKRLILNSAGGTPEFISKLNALDPSANQDFFLWHTWFKDIFDKGGFDIVIGNPPYIRRTELPETAKVEYERTYKSATLQYDIYLLFIEFGLSICSAKAQLCFINPIRFFSSDYGKGCRPIIIKNHYLWRVVDVSQIEVFKNAMTYPCVLHIQKTECKDYEIEFYSPENLQLVCNVATSKCKFLHKQNIISDSSCRIIVSEGYDLIQKIDNNSKPIETWYNVARGLPNNKVDFEGKKYKSLKSTMVKRYRITDDYKYINTEFSARFSKEMIILPRTVLFLQATLKEKDIVLLDRIYYLTEKTVVNSKFVLGVINARITTYWFEYYYGTTKVSGGYFDLNGTQIKNIPIPKATIEQQKQVAEIVDVILNEKKDNGNADTSDMEREIDRLVYKLYNLTDEEIAVIENNQ